jgi:malonyl-CoA O-methyltransferase
MSLQKIEPKLVSKRFDRASETYDEAAAVNFEIGERLIARLDYTKIEPKWVLDLGCGTGHFTRILQKRYKKSRVIGVDASERMIACARKKRGVFHKQQYLHASANALPFKGFQFDLIFCNLMLPWHHDVPALFHTLRQQLKAGGLLLFSTFGPNTLQSVRDSFAKVDTAHRVHTQLDMHDLGDALVQAQFSDPVVDSESLDLHYRDVDSALNELKQSGMTQALVDTHKGLTGKTRFNEFKKALSSSKTSDGDIPLHFDVVYGSAWANGDLNIQDKDHPDTHFIPVDQIQKKQR